MTISRIDQRTIGMLHYPNRDTDTPHQLDVFLDQIRGETLVPEMYGYDVSSSPDAATAAMLALDALDARGGGRLAFYMPGTYLLYVTGDATGYAAHKRCIEIPGDNIEIYIAPWATLKLADGQQTNAGGAVELIYFRNLSNIRICGGGRITGNTAGQSGWSGGYAQVTNGNIISGTGSASNGNHNILVENLTLDDHFSNPVNIDNNAAGRGSRTILRGLYGLNCGEGFQSLRADGCAMINCTFEDTSGVCVGDSFETLVCRGVLSLGCRVKASSSLSAGGGFDAAGSKYVIVDDLITDGWVTGTNLATQSGGTITVTIASPAVVSWTSHNLKIGDAVKFTTSGGLPTGITAGTIYYIVSAGFGANSFRIAATPSGTAINTSGSQSGTHTGHYVTDNVAFSNCQFINNTGTTGLDVGEGRIKYVNCHVLGGASTQLAQIADSDGSGLPPVELYNVWGDGCLSLLMVGNRRLIWHGGGMKNADSSDSVGVSLQHGAVSDTRNIDFDDLTFQGNTVADIRFHDNGSNNLTIQGSITNCRLLSTTPLSSAAGSRTHDVSALAISGIVTASVQRSNRALADNLLDAPVVTRNLHTGGLPARVSGDGNDSTPVTTEFYFAEVFVPQPTTATGVSVFWGSASSGNAKVGLADVTGAVVATSASTAQSGTDAYQRIAFTATEPLVPGIYYVLLFMDNNTVRFNTHTFGDFGTGKSTGQTYNTGFTTITPPTTFTANLGPIASLY